MAHKDEQVNGTHFLEGEEETSQESEEGREDKECSLPEERRKEDISE